MIVLLCTLGEQVSSLFKIFLKSLRLLWCERCKTCTKSRIDKVQANHIWCNAIPCIISCKYLLCLLGQFPPIRSPNWIVRWLRKCWPDIPFLEAVLRSNVLITAMTNCSWASHCPQRMLHYAYGCDRLNKMWYFCTSSSSLLQVKWSAVSVPLVEVIISEVWQRAFLWSIEVSFQSQGQKGIPLVVKWPCSASTTM